jgi:hypothetical protein
MQLPTFDEVVRFVREETGFRGQLTEKTSLYPALGIYGDDMDDFLTAYSKRFGVDMSAYLWYFHTGDEGGPGPGALFFPPPNWQVAEIPITLDMLHDFAQRGRWGVKYPKHKPPESRPDILINRIVVLTVFAVSVAVIVWGYVR